MRVRVRVRPLQIWDAISYSKKSCTLTSNDAGGAEKTYEFKGSNTYCNSMDKDGNDAMDSLKMTVECQPTHINTGTAALAAHAYTLIPWCSSRVHWVRHSLERYTIPRTHPTMADVQVRAQGQGVAVVARGVVARVWLQQRCRLCLSCVVCPVHEPPLLCQATLLKPCGAQCALSCDRALHRDRDRTCIVICVLLKHPNHTRVHTHTHTLSLSLSLCLSLSLSHNARSPAPAPAPAHTGCCACHRARVPGPTLQRRRYATKHWTLFPSQRCPPHIR